MTRSTSAFERTHAQPEHALVGFELHGAAPGADGNHRLGEILELVDVGGERYFLIDSRHWTYGSRRLLPTWTVSLVDLVEGVCHTDLAIDILRRAPDFDPFRLTDSRYQAVLRNVFGPAA